MNNNYHDMILKNHLIIQGGMKKANQLKQKKIIEVKIMHNLGTLPSPIWLLLFVSDLRKR
jgi:hypothetical protein